MCNSLMRLTNICIFSLVCIGMSGCTTTGLERSADINDTPVLPDYTFDTGDAAINSSEPASEDEAREGGKEHPVVQLSKISELAPEDDATHNGEMETGSSAEKQDAPRYDFPVVRNAQVEELLDYYTTGRGRRSFHLWLERSGRYLPLMKRVFADEGLPQDLAMLALIESGFNSNAHSWANAVGYWQFTESTGRMYGLENTWWRDERRDVEKATRAAAQYLSDLYARFDDWYLAAAAYNAGPGKMLNAIRRHNSRDFWHLAQGSYLRAETKRYIPKLLAAIIISKEPERYGFDQIEYAPPIEFDKVVVSQPTDLEVVVEITGVDYATIKRLNPELKRWCTPPGVEGYTLRVPPGAAQDFAERYAQIPTEQRNRYRRHELKAGESLALLAQRYNIRVQDIVIMNKISDPRRLQIGQNLILPLHHEYTSTPLTELEDDYLRTYRRSYTVRKGDSLWTIARKNSVTEKQLRVWNRLGWSDLIQPGQKLLVSAPPTRSNESYTPVRKVVHKVRKGDTLWDIGRRYSVEIGDIRQWNNLAENHMLRPGDELTLKLASGSS